MTTLLRASTRLICLELTNRITHALILLTVCTLHKRIRSEFIRNLKQKTNIIMEDTEDGVRKWLCP